METTNFDFFEKALTNPDFFTTLIILGLIFAGFIPLFLWVNKTQKSLIKDLIESNQIIMNNGFDRIARSIGKAVIDDLGLLISIGEKALNAGMNDKLNFLRRRLLQNEIKKDPENIKSHIKSKFNSINEIQVFEHLNNFDTPLGLFGNTIKDQFSYEGFYKALFNIFFDENHSLDRKIELIESIIYDYESEMWENLKLSFNMK